MLLNSIQLGESSEVYVDIVRETESERRKRVFYVAMMNRILRHFPLELPQQHADHHPLLVQREATRRTLARSKPERRPVALVEST